MPPLTMSRSSIDAEHAAAVGHDERRRAAARDRRRRSRRPSPARRRPRSRRTAARHRPRPCAAAGPRGRRRSCASARRTCGTCAAWSRDRGRAAGTAAWRAPRSSALRASRRRARRAAPTSASSAPSTPGAGWNAVAWRSPSVIVPVLSSSSTSTSPAASTARPEVAMTLARTMRSMPAMPIADSSPPIVVGIRHTSSATSTVSVTTAPCPRLATAYSRERRERRGRQQEHERQHREQDRQRDLVRRAAALRAFDHRDHAVEKALALAAGDAHHEPVGQHARAAGHGGEVATGLAQHRRGFAGHRAFVDRGDAFDDLAVGGDDVVRLDQHEVVAPQRAASTVW